MTPSPPISPLSSSVTSSSTDSSSVSSYAFLTLLVPALILLFLAGLFIYCSRPLDPRTLQPQRIDWRLDINQADASALAELPGIGPALAQRIVDYRLQHGPFARLQDLLLVPGIGPVIYARIEPYLTCSSASPDSDSSASPLAPDTPEQ